MVLIHACNRCRLARVEDGVLRCSIDGGSAWERDACPPAAPPPPTPLASRIVAGAVGLAKAAAGLDPASPEVRCSREAICAACDQVTGWCGGVVSRCRACGCVLVAKRAIAGERCPLGKW